MWPELQTEVRTTQHQKTHIIKRTNKCNECGNIFNRSSYLDVHKKFTQEGNSIFVVTMGKISVRAPVSFSISEFIQRKLPMNEISVERFSRGVQPLSCTRESIVEGSYIYVTNVERPSI